MQTATSELIQINTGLVIDSRITDWVFLGSSSSLDNQILIPTGDWSLYKTANEIQAGKYFDTWNCVAFSACNAIEVFFKYLMAHNLISAGNLAWLKEKGYLVNGEVNFSDRFVGQKAGTKVGVGNTGGRVANAIYAFGLVPEIIWPFNKDMFEEEYYVAPPKEVDDLGLKFKKRFGINFEVVFSQHFRRALQYSPIQVYVNAWYRYDNGLYYNPNKKVNHATLRLRSDEEQIFDHYNPYIKSLTTDYYYWPTGYKYTVVERINNMNIQDFLKKNDLLFVRNTETGQFGRIMQGELKVVNTFDRAVLLLLDDAVRNNGRGLTKEEWDLLPKKDF